MNPRTRRVLRRGALAFAAAVALVTAGGATAAVAAPGDAHYYIEAGGTGSAADAPTCTITYGYANESLPGGSAQPVCYAASAGPFVGSHNEMPAPNAPAMDASVAEGYRNMLAQVETTHRNDPGARITIVGYSQGAWVADLVLQQISSGATGVPREQVDGMLYSDPMQPGTGIWAKVPKGVSLFGITSPGPGPEHFDGIPVQRFCLHRDGICDATRVESFPGFFTEHPKYPQDNGIIEQTIAQDGTDGITWYGQ